MAADAPTVRLRDREVVIRFGEVDPAVFVLEDGVLEVRRGGVALARVDEPGSMIGELSLLLGTPASADVVAVGEVTLRRLEHPEQLFREVPEFGQFLATMLARRLHRVTSWMGDLQDQFADQPGALGVLPTVLSDLLADDRPEPEIGSDREPDVPY